MSSTSLREKVKQKFDGLCAYTGKPLGNDWQVDHMKSKRMFQQVLVREAYYKHSETGEEISLDEYQRRFDELMNNDGKRSEAYHMFHCFKYQPKKHKPHPNCNKFENLIPAIKIVNHYKREKDLEGFREYLKNFHKRLAKLPKRTSVESTKKRIVYMNTIAELFGITIEKPFSGKFYFETI